jgi:glycosyltransferase involved in cell wall biosynthesis
VRVLLFGDITTNCGPSNVHREFIEHWPADDFIDYTHKQSKVGSFFEGLAKGWRADVILSPCLNLPQIVALWVLHAVRKPIVCFNHGYVVFENDINGLGHSERWLNWYRNTLRSADLIVANSALQASFVLHYQPELAGKMRNILLGIEQFDQMESSAHDEETKVISLAGGSRPIKGNDVVIKACEILRSRGVDCRIQLYGCYSDDDDLIKALPKGDGVRVIGQVSHDRFIDALNRSSLFVMNSRHEPFGLSALDALRAGCSVLLSKDCGVLEALTPKGSDVVEDCEDAEEVADKMAYLLGHPNARRLYESIDFDALSWDTQVGRLRQMCADAVARKGGAR